MAYRLYDEDGCGNCLECGQELYGRADKKFCNDSCRNHYYGKIRSKNRSMHNRVINRLDSNYRILQELIHLNKHSASMQDLIQLGFHPDYVTSHVRVGKGADEYRCFNIAYRQSLVKIYDIKYLD